MSHSTTLDATPSSDTSSPNGWRAVEYAERGIKAGLSLIPYALRTKAPRVKGLQDGPALTLGEFNAEADKLGPDGFNIGLRLTNGLVDVDFDSSETQAIAKHLLPPGGQMVGRESKPYSHAIFRSPDAKRAVFSDPTLTKEEAGQYSHGKILLEIRTTGQTLVHGIHPNGECVSPAGAAWQEPSEVSAEALTTALGRIAAASLLARHWSKADSRQRLALGIVGYLANAGWTEEEARTFLGAILEAVGDEERDMRLNTIDTTYRALKDGDGAVGGASIILEQLGAESGKKILKAIEGWLPVPGARGGSSKGENLFKIAKRLSKELYVTPSGMTYARLEGRGIVEIDSADFEDAIHYDHLKQQGAPLDHTDLRKIASAMSAVAKFEGTKARVFYRIGEDDEGNIWHDLGGGRYVKITKYGYTVKTSTPVLFRTEPGMLTLPKPDEIHHMADASKRLISALGLKRPEDIHRVIGWLIAAMRPDAQYPLLQINGGQGQGKTTLARKLRRIIDPQDADITGKPKSEKDLYLAAHHAACLLFDNLSFLNQAMSDALCRLSTNGGYSDRKLYRDTDLVTFTGQVPIISTGINEVVYAGDLASRTITIEAPELTEDRRAGETALWAEYEAALPTILGVVYGALSAALRNFEHTTLTRKPRMMDAALWVTAAEKELGWPSGAFVAALLDGEKEAQANILEGSAFGAELIKHIRKKDFMGSVGELLDALEEQRELLGPGKVARDSTWPKTPRAAAHLLKRLDPALGAVGIRITRPGRRPGTGENLIALEYLNERAAPQPPTKSELFLLPQKDESQDDGLPLEGEA